MRKRFFYYLAAVCVCTLMFICCATHHHTAYYDFKTKLIGTEMDGSYTVTAWGRARTALDAFQQAQKQAVYDIVFTGVEPQTSNLTRQLPLLLEVNAKDKYQDYFNNFFMDKGEYVEYCSAIDKKFGSTEYYRSDKQVVCKTTVRVYRSKLKNKLIQDNIIKN